MMYTADIKLLLTSQYTDTVPVVTVKVNQVVTNIVSVEGPTVIRLQTQPQMPGPCVLSIVFSNKDYSEFEKYAQDMMVTVDQVLVQDYEFDFSGHSVYHPIYPEPWATQQKDLGNILLPKIHSNYLGWNGEWQLNLEMPIYRWIHKTVNLGWLI